MWSDLFQHSPVYPVLHTSPTYFSPTALYSPSFSRNPSTLLYTAIYALPYIPPSSQCSTHRLRKDNTSNIIHEKSTDQSRKRTENMKSFRQNKYDYVEFVGRQR